MVRIYYKEVKILGTVIDDKIQRTAMIPFTASLLIYFNCGTDRKTVCFFKICLFSKYHVFFQLFDTKSTSPDIFIHVSTFLKALLVL